VGFYRPLLRPPPRLLPRSAPSRMFVHSRSHRRDAAAVAAAASAPFTAALIYLLFRWPSP